MRYTRTADSRRATYVAEDQEPGVLPDGRQGRTVRPVRRTRKIITCTAPPGAANPTPNQFGRCCGGCRTRNLRSTDGPRRTWRALKRTMARSRTGRAFSLSLHPRNGDGGTQPSGSAVNDESPRPNAIGSVCARTTQRCSPTRARRRTPARV